MKFIITGLLILLTSSLSFGGPSLSKKGIDSGGGDDIAQEFRSIGNMLVSYFGKTVMFAELTSLRHAIKTVQVASRPLSSNEPFEADFSKNKIIINSTRWNKITTLHDKAAVVLKAYLLFSPQKKTKNSGSFPDPSWLSGSEMEILFKMAELGSDSANQPTYNGFGTPNAEFRCYWWKLAGPPESDALDTLGATVDPESAFRSGIWSATGLIGRALSENKNAPSKNRYGYAGFDEGGIALGGPPNRGPAIPGALVLWINNSLATDRGILSTMRSEISGNLDVTLSLPQDGVSIQCSRDLLKD